MTEREIEIRKEIMAAIAKLKEKELVARTWGNISARLSDTEFIITPSGLSYDLTSEADLVKLNIADLSYDENSRKPSSEKGFHAEIYKAKKDVNFIIHTHQFFASAICAEGKDVVHKGMLIPCVDYALPGTDKLKDKVVEALRKHKESNVFLLNKHGAIVAGKDSEEAFNLTENLENDCKTIFAERVPDFMKKGMLLFSEKNHAKGKAYLDDFAQMFPLPKDATIDDQEAFKFIDEKNNAAALYSREKALGFFDRFVQHYVYIHKYSKMKGGKNGQE